MADMTDMTTTINSNTTAKHPHPSAMDWSNWTAPEHHCKVCDVRVYRPRIVFDAAGESSVYCALHIPKAHRDGGEDRAKNPYQNFTLDHVRDEYGKKVVVNSQAELRAAEKRYNFSLAVAADDGGLAAAPPQHESWAGDITHDYKKKFNLNPADYAEAAKHAEAGVVSDLGETLAVKPNASGAIRGKKR